MIQIVGDLGDTTLGPGTYVAAAAISLTGTLTLDAGNDPNAEWVFNINAALSTAAGSTIVLIDEGLPGNVDWNVNGAVTTGAKSTLVGNIVAVGAVALGADAQVDGTIESSAGAKEPSLSARVPPFSVTLILVGPSLWVQVPVEPGPSRPPGLSSSVRIRPISDPSCPMGPSVWEQVLKVDL
jgi:hypothetical protein